MGSTDYATSTSSAVIQVVNPAPTTTALSAAPNPSTFGETVTLTATVTPAAATGKVNFLNNGKNIGSGTLGGGVASLAISTLAAGVTHSLTAMYVGSTDYATSTSSAVALQFTVARRPDLATGA